MKDYYKILELDKTSSTEEIKKQYRRFAIKYHPDVSTEENSTQKFQEIQEAYTVLKDPEKKAAYDAGVDPFNASTNHNYRRSHRGPIDINDLFDALRGRHNFHAQARRAIYRINITLEEAFSGTARRINDTTFRVPPGLRTGNRISFNDFFVDIVVLPHAKYKRAGDDLLIEVSITAVEAIVGTKILFHHIDDTQIKCTVPPGTQPEQVLRLKGKGMPNPEVPNMRGDLLVQLHVTIPTDLTNEQKESIIQLGHREEIQL